MGPVLRKLNARPGAPVTVLAAPPELEPLLARWADEADVRRRLGAEEPFVLAFVRAADEVAGVVAQVVPVLAGDAVLWLAYPKRSSRHRSDLSQVHGWQPLGDAGFEAVRQVSLDADWSALRFRRVEHIVTLRRQAGMTLSDEGRRRVAERDAEPG